MGITATSGKFGIGIQTTANTAAATKQYIQATNVGIQPEQQAQPVPPEVGGTMWSAGAYKSGVSALGDVAMTARANTLGWILKSFAGRCVSAAGTDSGTFDHTIDEAPDHQIPWVTCVKDVGGLFADEYVDCKIDTLRLDIPAAGILSVSAGIVGRKVANLAIPTATWDYSPIFESAVATLDIDGVTDAKISRMTLEFSNNLTRDERSIGSYFLDGVTIVRKTCRVSMDINIYDSVLYRQVYNNGTADWSPSIHTADMTLTLNTTKPVVTTFTGSLEITLPQVEYLTMPLPMSGQDIIRATLTAEVSVGSNPAFGFLLHNSHTAYAAS